MAAPLTEASPNIHLGAETTRVSPKKTISDGSDTWLNAHQDPVAGIHATSQCICTEDLNGDNDHKLIIADMGTTPFGMQLKIYKGTSLMTNMPLIDLPCGVCSFYIDTNEPRIPAIAVASGSYVYVYKNLRPYFKFTLPSLDINTQESQLWKNLRNDETDIFQFRELLENLQESNQDIPITSRSLKFLQCPPEEIEDFNNQYKYAPLKRQTVITCISTLNKSHSDEKAVSCIVIGTENCEIFILDPEAFTAIGYFYLPFVPVHLLVSGVFDVEYRIITSCRNGIIYIIRRGTKIPKQPIQIGSHIVGIESFGKNIIVGSMDETISSYTSRGKKLWSIQLPSSISAMESLEVKSKGIKGVIVALNNGEIRIYKDKILVNRFSVGETISGIKFGRFGREESTLILISNTGKLFVRILKRTASLDNHILIDDVTNITPANLNLPKKSKFYADQALREKENAISIFQTFTRDFELIKLRINKTYLESLTSRTMPMSIAGDSLKMSAQVQGMGPLFKLYVSLQNSSNIAIVGLLITFLYNPILYAMQKNFIHVPFLAPTLNYSFESTVESLSDTCASESIKTVISKQGSNIPIVTALITMPSSLSIQDL